MFGKVDGGGIPKGISSMIGATFHRGLMVTTQSPTFGPVVRGTAVRGDWLLEKMAKCIILPFTMKPSSESVRTLMRDWVDIRREFPWLGNESIFLVNENALQILIQGLSKQGFSISFLEGTAIVDEETFFSAIATSLNFPAYFGKNWDAFADCFGDLAYRPEKRRAIIWKQASVSLRNNLYVFVKAVHELLNASADVGRCDSKETELAQVEVFLLGDVPAFAKRPREK